MIKNYKFWTWTSLIIIAALALKYGGSTHYILSDISNGFSAGVKALTLSGTPGNSPSGGNLIQGA